MKRNHSLVLWYVIWCALSLMQFSGLFIPIAILISFFCILRKLFRLPGQLDKAGYTIQPAPVKLSSPMLVSSLCGILAAGITVGYLFFGRYPMEWNIAEQEQTATLADARAHLIELGFPEDILDDLTSEDIYACQNAVRVIVSCTEYTRQEEALTTPGKGRFVTYHTIIHSLGDRLRPQQTLTPPSARMLRQ